MQANTAPQRCDFTPSTLTRDSRERGPLSHARTGISVFLAGLLMVTSSITLAGDDDIVLTISGGQDNTLYETDSGNLSNGMGAHLFVGRTGNDGGNRVRRALIKFDLSAVTPGATAQNVDFTFTVNREPLNNGAPPTTVNLHKLTADWGEGASDAPGSEGIGTIAQPGDATWLHRFFDTDFWGTDGGDFLPTPSATMVIDDPGTYTFVSTPQMVADVQDWLDNPNNNFGWIIIGSEQGSVNARRISSSQNSNSAEVPVLGLTYTPAVIAPPSVIPTLSGVGLVVLLSVMLGLGVVVLGRQRRLVQTSNNTSNKKDARG